MIDLRFGRWQEVLADVEMVDAVITDPPYGERTHSGHGQAVGIAGNKREVDYSSWSANDVEDFVRHWSPRCRGWFVAMTSHDLFPAYEEALLQAGRYVFDPKPYVAPGSRMRTSGDGPASWSVWLVIARPRYVPYCRWGSLPGAYILPKGFREKMPIVGGKPLWLMRALIRDYTKPGDLVCDPCAGAGTTLKAAAIEGRNAIGAEQDRKHFEIAQSLLASGYVPDLFAQGAGNDDQEKQLQINA